MFINQFSIGGGYHFEMEEYKYLIFAMWAMWLCGPCQARALQAECIGASVASELYAYVAWGATMHLVLWGASVTCPTVELMLRMRRWYNLTCPNLFFPYGMVCAAL